MENKGQKDSEDAKIQGLLDAYLQLRNPGNGSVGDDNHLDEDSLTAFVEGNLVARETQPVVEHLVDCSFCRHISVELIKLDMAFAGEAAEVTVQESRPAKVSEVLSGLLSRIFGTNDSAVFAHQEKEEQEEETKDSENIKE